MIRQSPHVLAPSHHISSFLCLITTGWGQGNLDDFILFLFHFEGYERSGTHCKMRIILSEFTKQSKICFHVCRGWGTPSRTG